ncbi:hypothetical protein C2E23DRAFT_741031, partial [Lenzites betulinus]
GKGKGRADDSAGYSSDSIRTSTPHEGDNMTVRGEFHAGIEWNMKNGSPYRVGGEPDLAPSALSTPPYPADLSDALVEDAEPDTIVSRVAPPIRTADNGLLPDPAPFSDGDGAQPSTLQRPSMEGRQTGRIRRNPWQTMQEYLSSGLSGSRPSRPSDKSLSAEQTLEVRSQAQVDAASSLRGGALRPEDPSSFCNHVPSLLSRLSDPAPRVTNTQNTSPEVPDAARAVLPAHEDGKRMSAPEIMARTRARLSRMATAGDQSSIQSLPPSAQHPGAGPQSATSHHAAVGVGDVGAVERHMSSEDACQSQGTARSGVHAPGLATSADPRTLLMQKLAAEKRDAADIHTAEKAQLSSAPPSSVPMVLAAGSSTASGAARSGGPSKPAPNVVSAERLAERREAELRSQAQLRVRLAAAKRAAQRGGAASGGGTGGSTGTIDEDLAVQESSLRSRLKGRQAGPQT